MSSRAAKRYEQQLCRKYLETEEDDMTNEELDFAALEAELNRATAAYEAAKQEAYKRKEEYDTAANLLAQAHAAKAGITVGTIIEFAHGRSTSRGRVETVNRPRWLDKFCVSVRVILRDGSEGKRLVLVDGEDFSPRDGFTGKRPPRARIVNDPSEV